MSENDNDSAASLACGKLLSLAAHEFRTPLSVVSGYVRMLQRDGAASLTDHQRKILDEAEKSCERLSVLIGELSEIGKLDAGTAVLAHDAFDVFALVGDVVREARADGPEIAAEGEQTGARVTGDRIRLRAALSSLLRAIVRERPETPTVVVDRRLIASVASSTAVIVIGTAAELMGALEAPREPIDEGRGGLGLALPTARRIVEQHHGSVWSAGASARPPGRGAVVISLPCETGPT